MGRAGKYGESDDDALPFSPGAARKTNNQNYRPSTSTDEKKNDDGMMKKKEKGKLKLAPGSHNSTDATAEAASKDRNSKNQKKASSKKKHDNNNLKDSKVELAPGEHREEMAQRGEHKKAGALMQASTACRATQPGTVAVSGKDSGNGKEAKKSDYENLQLASGDHREEQTNEFISEKKRAGVVDDNKNATSAAEARHSTNTTRSSNGAANRRTHRQLRASMEEDYGEPSDSDDESSEEDEDMVPGATNIEGVRGSNPNLDEYDPTDQLQDDEDVDVEANQNRIRQSQANSEGLAEAILVEEDEGEHDDDADGSIDPQDVPKDAVIAEEVGKEGEIDKSAKGWIIRNKRIVLLMVILLCAVVVIVAVFASRATSNDGGNPTTSQPPPTAPPTAKRISQIELCLQQQSNRFREVYGIVSNYTSSSSSSPEILLCDNTTAQHLALRWIADEDFAQLNSTTRDLELIIQRYGLAVIYFATNGDDWDERLNFLNETHECDWNDVGTDDSTPQSGVVSCNEDGFITSLQLRALNLNGTIPDELSIFSSLELLDLSENILGGTLPSTMGELTSMTELRLFSNVLSGSIPSSLGNMTDLEMLSFEENQLNGVVPPSIGGLTKLKNLDGSFNRLVGQLPSEIGTLTDLTLFFVQNNQLTGTIPATMANLTSLRQVDVSYNSLIDGANNLCEIDSLVVYLADCYEQLIPVIEGDICCNCCSQCCSDSEVTNGCFGNTNEPC